MEKLILATCKDRKELTDAELTKVLISSKLAYTDEKKQDAINKLLAKGRLGLRAENDEIIYEYNSTQAA
jgi:hypothetical protein